MSEAKTTAGAVSPSFEWAYCMVCGDQVEASDETFTWEHVLDNTELCYCEDTHLGYVCRHTVEGLFSSQLVVTVPDVLHLADRVHRTMSVDKARAALEAAKALDIDGVPADQHGLTPMRVAEQFQRLLSIANSQAAIAQAEALDRIAASLEAREVAT